MKSTALTAVVCALCLWANSASASLIDFSHVWTAADPSGPDRLVRDGISSVAGVAKPFPGTLPNNPTYFSTLSLAVVPGSLVTVTQLPDNGDLISFFSIYDSSFSPGNLANNYLGDAGLSGPGPVFSIFAPASGLVTVVASSVSGNSALGVLAHASIDFTAAAAVPEPTSMAMLGLGVAGFGLYRRRKAGQHTVA